MNQCTTSTHLTRTIHQLEHILADEDIPATRAASLLAETLCEIALELPEEDQQQIARIVALYAQCVYKQEGPLSRRHRRKGH
jgi:capsid protein